MLLFVMPKFWLNALRTCALPLLAELSISYVNGVYHPRYAHIRTVYWVTASFLVSPQNLRIWNKIMRTKPRAAEMITQNIFGKRKTGSSSISSSQSQNISDDRLLARISHRTGTRGREVSHESFGRSHDSTRSYALAPNVADECWARVTY